MQIDEIVIWDYLVKWGIKQTPELENKNNRDEWTDKNYDDLKNTLSDFIPLIKFLRITSEDFHIKVRPYKSIIPNNIYEDTMTYYLVEQPKLLREKEEKIESEEREKQYKCIIITPNIMKPTIANIIANWIEKRDDVMLSHDERDPIYKFNLIYTRGGKRKNY